MHLQRLIRGRAIQAMMFESRKQRQLLINELRSTHALTKEERAEKRRQMLTIRTNQTRYEHLQYEVCRGSSLIVFISYYLQMANYKPHN